MKKLPEQSPWMTTRETGERLGVSEQTVRRMCEAGAISALRVRKHWRVSRTVVDALAATAGK